MWLKRQYMEIAIGLSAFGLTMATLPLPHHFTRELEPIRVLQFAATLPLLFGVLKAHEKHKDKLLLVWLCLTAVTIGFLLYAGSRMIFENGYWLSGLLTWLTAAAIATLLNTEYNYYVELTIDAADAVTEVVLTNQPSIYPTKNQFMV